MNRYKGKGFCLIPETNKLSPPQMMKGGDKWRLVVISELGYGVNGSGLIPGNTTLVCEVELIAVR